MARLSAYRVGHCTHPACMALKGGGLGRQCFPSRAYLVETAQGFVLWDTGYAERFQAAVSEGIFRLYGWVTPVYFDPHQALHLQLREQGLAPRDVRWVVLSHFHADHLAGLRDFPDASIVCDRAAWDQVRELSGWSAVRQAFIPALLPPDIATRLQFVDTLPQRALPVQLQPFTRAYDLTGQGELLIVDLPGHAVGHLGAFVVHAQGWTLLASDAAWMPDGYRTLRGPSELSFLIQHDRRQYYQTLASLHALHLGGQARILLTHEEDAPS
jgi:glyoxylase-like metal-dependent hydrolase (beta-lactamase superfamily II)